MQILITGGAGFVGSHLTDRLISDGHSVVILDDVSTGRLENLKQYESHSNFEYINGSVLDQGLLESTVKDVDYIFHLAAAVGVFNIVNHPLSSLVTNIRGTENVLEAALTKNTPVFLSSSSEVYGKNSSDSL